MALSSACMSVPIFFISSKRSIFKSEKLSSSIVWLSLCCARLTSTLLAAWSIVPIILSMTMTLTITVTKVDQLLRLQQGEFLLQWQWQRKCHNNYNGIGDWTWQRWSSSSMTMTQWQQHWQWPQTTMALKRLINTFIRVKFFNNDDNDHNNDIKNDKGWSTPWAVWSTSSQSHDLCLHEVDFSGGRSTLWSRRKVQTGTESRL